MRDDMTSGPVLQSTAPDLSDAARPLPGISPIDPADWLVADDAFAGQMALRERLLAEKRTAVLAETEESGPAVAELLETVLAHLATRPGYSRAGDLVTRPDGGRVALDGDTPLAVLGRLCPEDFCLLERPEGAEAHLLSAAVLCFPASWTLAEKIGRPLPAIHVPVASYDDGLARRVQRLFDGVQPGRPLMRRNLLRYSDPSLHQPRTEADPRPVGHPGAPFLRSERQCLLRLPITRAVVFSIHTTMVRAGDAG